MSDHQLDSLIVRMRIRRDQILRSYGTLEAAGHWIANDKLLNNLMEQADRIIRTMYTFEYRGGSVQMESKSDGITRFIDLEGKVHEERGRKLSPTQ